LLLPYSFSSSISLQAIPQNIIKAQKILDLIYKNKYFTNAQLLYSKLKYLLNEKNFCIELIQSILQIDPRNLNAFTFYAILMIDMQDFAKAKEIINEAMISNLAQTREHGYFLISKVKCEFGVGDYDSANKTLIDVLKNFDKFISDDKNCEI